MQKLSQLFFILYSLFSFSQQTIVELEKTAYSEFKLDGILSEEELKNTKIIDIIYEHEPGYNTSPSNETRLFLKFQYLIKS